MEAAENRPVFDLTLTTEVRKMRTLLDEMKPTFDQTVAEQANMTQVLTNLKETTEQHIAKSETERKNLAETLDGYMTGRDQEQKATKMTAE